MRNGIARAALCLLAAMLLPVRAAGAEALSQPVDPPAEEIDWALAGDAAGESALGEAQIMAAPEAEAERVLLNASLPAERYEPRARSYRPSADASIKAYAGDTVEIDYKSSKLLSVVSSDPSVAEYAPPFFKGDAACLNLLAPGKATVTFALKNGKVRRLKLTVRDPYALRGLSLNKSSASLDEGGSLCIRDYLALKPAYAAGAFRYSSSDPEVASVDGEGVVVGRKPGKAAITVVGDGKYSAKFAVRIRKNALGGLSAAPTKRELSAMKGRWCLRPSALRIMADGSAVCELYLLNGLTNRRLEALYSLDLAVYRVTKQGNILVGRTAFGGLKVSCPKRSSKLIAITLPAEDVVYPLMNLRAMKPEGLTFALCAEPTAQAGKTLAEYDSDAGIPVIDDPDGENPVACRALLVGEVGFGWDYCPRNGADVTLMSKMLKGVRGPEGGGYAVTVRKDVDGEALKASIASAFAGADENDVSLFFIATHGFSDENCEDGECGMLSMVNGEGTQEYLTLGELRDCLLAVPGRVVVILESCGSGSAIYKDPDAGKGFDEAFVRAFERADPGLDATGGDVPKTAELRRAKKFYVLTASAHQEDSWGVSTGNFFTRWLVEGVGASGDMPADAGYGGNGNGIVDLYELYRYISAVGDGTPILAEDGFYYQHVQVYPAVARLGLFS